jgi:cytochrome c peroxidase
MTRDVVVKAIATFERALVSARSPFDRYRFDRDESAISVSAKRGEVLFHSRPLSCFACHGGLHFSSAMGSGMTTLPVEFHNTRLYNVGGLLSYRVGNGGVFETTRRLEGVGRFKAPTLRNIAVTAPYMHDGSVATLDEVIDHAAGGRTIERGPHRGVGRNNPNKATAIRGHALLTDLRFANPFTRSYP